MALEARRITHRFEDVSVLSDVELRVEPGRAVALIGPNGAGKTTLARIGAGLLSPSSGDVTLDGRSLSGLSRRDLAKAISVVPQAKPVAFAFTALEFVLMGLHSRSSRFSLDGPDARSAASDALEQLGMSELADRSMTTLSGGEAQRVVMARTLVSGANYWILDEPTANLDVAHQLDLLEVVRSHCDAGGAALAIVHDVNLVERWFDDVVILSDGKVIASGPAETTLSADVLTSVFDVPMRRLSDEGVSAWVATGRKSDPLEVERVVSGGPEGESK